MIEAELRERMEGMDLRQKIGQLFFCGFEGTEPSDNIKRLIEEYHVGGIIYFARNVVSVDQVTKLSSSLQRIAEESGNPPLWISIDQEGGMVARITEGVALMPGNMAIAAAGRPESAYEAAIITGQELLAMGINLNLAPVLDVNNNALNPVIGVRSYGELPEMVAEYGVQAVRGMQAAGVTATIKHFPGHGDTDTDSHLDLPTIRHDRERIERMELVPFRRAIEAGVDAVMSSHIYFPAFEPRKLPATLSHSILTDMLRGELGFEGVIMTDCMEMKAIKEHYGTVEASVMALEAGADLILISHTFDVQTRAIDALYEAVRGGRIRIDQIDASVRRVLAYKAKRGILNADTPDPAVAFAIGCGEHLETARRISESSITLVQDSEGVLPLRRERTLVVTIDATITTVADESLGSRRSLGEALARQGLEVVDRVMLPEAVTRLLDQLLEEARDESIQQIVIGTYNAQFDVSQLEVVERLNKIGKPLIVVALRNPYDLLKLPKTSAYIAAYESRPLALESTAKAMMGIIPFRGRLPVSLGDKYTIGWGVMKP